MRIASGNGVVLLAVFAIVCTIRNSSANRKWKHQFAQFKDAVIVVVRGRTEQAEPRLFGIVARSDANRNGCCENAVLLPSTGEKPAKIIVMLNLPLSQLKRTRTAEAVAPGSQVGGAEKRDQEGYCSAQGLYEFLVLTGEGAVS